MIYIDKILLSIALNKSYELNNVVPPRESNVLKSLANSLSGPHFITENQSRLLMKILKDTHHKFGDMSETITTALADPLWSRPFRTIEQVKKMYIDRRDDSSTLCIEFTFSANIKKIITQMSKDIENLVQHANGKMYNAEMTENNIVLLVDALRPLDFIIDDEIMAFYDTISAWTSETIREQFLLTNMSSQNFVKHITADLGESTPIDQNIIHDRSVRYRYLPGPALEPDGTLVREIASRGKSKIWIDKSKHDLDEVVGALFNLKRLPLLVVFDSFEGDKAHGILDTLSKAFDKYNVSNVGIYFRLPNTDVGIKFNELVAKRQYNQYLGTDTEVVGVQSGKIPKFLLTSNWTPMSVLSIDTQLRNSKTAVYASCCDLIISYSDTPPMVEKTEKWL